MFHNILFFSLCLFHLLRCNAAIVNKPFVIIVPSYNNSAWYERNLDSIRTQTYPHYHVFYIDDCSTDGTSDAVAAYIERHELNNTITIIKNSERRGMLYNVYTAVHCCPDEAIIVILDGDDWFANDTVLAYLNELYQDPAVWMTYGQFQEYPSGNIGFCAPIPDAIANAHAYRLYDWVSSHVKTFYAGLFNQVPRDYFVRNGNFLQSAGDCAIMFALLELADGHAKFVPDVLYVYNMDNATSVFRTRPLEQLRNMYWVRNCEPLASVQQPFSNRKQL